MTTVPEVATWIDAYVRAWNTNSREDIEALFTADAAYRSAPFRPPVQGRDAIVTWWLEHQDEPGQTSFDWEPVALTDDVAVVEGTTRYPDRTYRNLWVLRLVGDRCHDFTDWWMEEP